LDTAHLIDAGLSNIVIIAPDLGKLLFIEAKLKAVDEIETCCLRLGWLSFELSINSIGASISNLSFW